MIRLTAAVMPAIPAPLQTCKRHSPRLKFNSLSLKDTHNIATDVFLHVGSLPLLTGAAVTDGIHPASTATTPILKLFGAIAVYSEVSR